MQALYQQRGQIVQDWLTYPTEPCPIPRSTLIFQDLSASPVYVAEGGHDGVLPPAYDVNYPRDVGAVDESHFRRYIVEQDNPHQEWFGITAPGVLIIEDIKRQKTKPPRTDLSMSEISMAVYTDRFDASTLRYVIYANVNNKETLFVGRCLYEMRRPSTDIQVWEYGSPEYQKFLGSRLGKLTAYMLLGTFERGTRRIARRHSSGAGTSEPGLGYPLGRVDELESNSGLETQSVSDKHGRLIGQDGHDSPDSADSIGLQPSVARLRLDDPPAEGEAPHILSRVATSHTQSESAQSGGEISLGNPESQAVADELRSSLASLNLAGSNTGQPWDQRPRARLGSMTRRLSFAERST
ncbi:hypothetical protein N7512_003852 [Penicillium capsulatum]|nr:hypothetical protein N7512_003852 [Penicillium capsulatum]